MAGAATTTTSLASMVKGFYDKLLLERLTPLLRYDQFAVKKRIPLNEGKTIHWNRLTNLGLGYTLTELDVPGLSAMSATRVSATVIQKGYVIGISDMYKDTAISKPVLDAVALLTDGAALTVDWEYKDKIGFSGHTSMGVVAAASATYPSARSIGFPLLTFQTVTWSTVPLGIGIFSAALATSGVLYATTHLRKMNCKPFDDGYFVGIIDPDIARMLMSDPDFKDWNSYTGEGQKKGYKGEIGFLMGTRFVDTTSSISTTVTASAWSTSRLTAGGTLYGTLIFGKGAYAGVHLKAGRQGGTEIITTPFTADKADPLAMYGTAGYKITMAAKILNPSCGIIIGNYISN